MPPVTAEDVQELRELAKHTPDDESLRPLDTQPKLFAFVIAWSRAEGRNEVDDIELLCRAGEFTQRELRECIAVLAPLGYDAVVARLRKLARRKRCS
jgi:hypothetical protein